MPQAQEIFFADTGAMIDGIIRGDQYMKEIFSLVERGAVLMGVTHFIRSEYNLVFSQRFTHAKETITPAHLSRLAELNAYMYLYGEDGVPSNLKMVGCSQFDRNDLKFLIAAASAATKDGSSSVVTHSPRLLAKAKSLHNISVNVLTAKNFLEKVVSPSHAH
ncbi:MAG: hypothetical protein WAV40_00810 [Microgenomates group bacterium]